MSDEGAGGDPELASLGEQISEIVASGSKGVIRIFQSAIHPADVEIVRRCFAEDVRPAFEAADGCLSIELAINAEAWTTGLIEGTAISKWEGLEAMETALESRALQESQVRIQQYLRTLPLVQIFTVLE